MVLTEEEIRFLEFILNDPYIHHDYENVIDKVTGDHWGKTAQNLKDKI